MEHRAAGKIPLEITTLPAGSHLVRFLIDDRPEAPYDRMIVVTEMDEGSVLFLAGWIGTPLTASEWRAARDQLFPAAREVRFIRVHPVTGVERQVALPIREPA